MSIIKKRRFRLFSGLRSQVEAATMEVDGMNEVALIPEAALGGTTVTAAAR
jgi:hypothetical protein